MPGPLVDQPDIQVFVGVTVLEWQFEIVLVAGDQDRGLLQKQGEGVVTQWQLPDVIPDSGRLLMVTLRDMAVQPLGEGGSLRLIRERNEAVCQQAGDQQRAGQAEDDMLAKKLHGRENTQDRKSVV